MTTPFASRSRFTVLAGSMVALLAAGCAHGSYETTSGGEVVRAGVARRPVSDIIAALPDKQRETATLMRSKHGEPTVAGDGELVWYNTGPFVKTAIARDAAPHNFPMPHTDYLTQTVRHRVPADKLAALNEYDGSVIYHRTRGELSAQCDKEEMNFLALNLAHDIITGKRTVDDARAFYAKTAMAFKQGDRSSPYVNGLLFQQEPNAADPDHPHPM